jgi:hypothetical protein
MVGVVVGMVAVAVERVVLFSPSMQRVLTRPSNYFVRRVFVRSGTDCKNVRSLATKTGSHFDALAPFLWKTP